MVEHDLAKVGVAGSNPVSRSSNTFLVTLLLLLASTPALATVPDPASPGSVPDQSIGLDWVDARYSDYLTQVKRRIQSRWDYRCIKKDAPRACDHLGTQLIVEFAIRPSGELQHVRIQRSSGEAAYDRSAVTAISAASPYPAVPPDMVKEGDAGLLIRASFTHVIQPRMSVPRASPLPAPTNSIWPVLTWAVWSVVVGVLAVGAFVWLVWSRRRVARGTAIARRPRDNSAAQGEPRPEPTRDVSSAPSAYLIAHDALLSLGWRHDGEIAVQGLEMSPAHTYLHPDLPRHRINVAPTGEWEHTAIPGVAARGATADELVQHIGAIHGTLSIADLHLPGRRPS